MWHLKALWFSRSNAKGHCRVDAHFCGLRRIQGDLSVEGWLTYWLPTLKNHITHKQFWIFLVVFDLRTSNGNCWENVATFWRSMPGQHLKDFKAIMAQILRLRPGYLWSIGVVFDSSLFCFISSIVFLLNPGWLRVKPFRHFGCDVDTGWKKYKHAVSCFGFTPVDSNFKIKSCILWDTEFINCWQHFPKKNWWDGAVPWGQNWRSRPNQIIEEKGPAGQCKVQGPRSLDKKSHHWRSLSFEYKFLKRCELVNCFCSECWIWCYIPLQVAISSVSNICMVFPIPSHPLEFRFWKGLWRVSFFLEQYIDFWLDSSIGPSLVRSWYLWMCWFGGCMRWSARRTIFRIEQYSDAEPFPQST